MTAGDEVENMYNQTFCISHPKNRWNGKVL